ncbi:RYR3 protein, partial [Rhinopomastus cyanomelas]|nr:RYR3 protein [Rhinopomastus cyanomelas]
TLKELISQTMVRWSQEDQIQDPELVRIMYTLLRRQYDSIGELLQALRKAYTISAASVKDTINLLAALGQIRSLLSVRMGKEEELLMINGLGKSKVKQASVLSSLCLCLMFLSPLIPLFLMLLLLDSHVFGAIFALFDYLLLIFYLLYYPGNFSLHEFLLYTATPLSLCLHSSCTSLKYLVWCTARPRQHCKALHTRCSCFVLICSQLRSRQVVTYLAGCGLQSCPVLLAKGYPDIGWNPIEGERYLSFLRFAVFVN